MNEVQFWGQTQNNTATVLGLLKNILENPNLERVRVAVAYARWDGIGLLSKELEGFLDRGGTYESIYGAGNGVTTPDSLLYSIYLSEIYPGLVKSFLVEDHYQNSIFHPKAYEFRFKNYSIIIVGSANLTGGGLVRNSELVAKIKVRLGSSADKDFDKTWKSYRRLALPITAKRIRDLMRGERAGSEADKREGLPKSSSKPFLKSGVKAAPKPLFKKILNLSDYKKKSVVLSNFDSLSQKPSRLYLQIFPYETGGSAGNPGYQVQLPVATLATFFGVGEAETKLARFQFKDEMIEAHLTHFKNNTHRVRLKPILQIPRPAILIFERIEEGLYTVKAERTSRYQASLNTKCTQQSRTGSRRWGLE